MVQWNGLDITLMEKAINSHHFSEFSNFVKDKFEKLGFGITGGHLFTNDKNDIHYDKIIKVMNLFD
jgi:hypothetical protein